jgi:hypothetical protein
LSQVENGVVGDLRGQYYGLLRIGDHGGSPSNQTSLFFGDYVARGPQNIELINLLLVGKIMFPEHL